MHRESSPRRAPTSHVRGFTVRYKLWTRFFLLQPTTARTATRRGLDSHGRAAVPPAIRKHRQPAAPGPIPGEDAIAMRLRHCAHTLVVIGAAEADDEELGAEGTAEEGGRAGECLHGEGQQTLSGRP